MTTNKATSTGCDEKQPLCVRHRPEVAGRPWIWFDLDDTLYDFENNSLEALHRIYVDQQLNRWWPDAQTWIDEYHVVNSELWALYSPGLITREQLRMERFRRPLVARGCPDEQARALSLELDPIYLRHLASLSRVLPGAIELLHELYPLYNIGVLSNGFREVQYGKMHSAGLAPYIDCTVLSDEIDINKPNLPIFRYAEDKAGTTSENCLLIGDNPDTDIRGAIQAEWKAILFLRHPLKEGTSAPEGVPAVASLSQIGVATAPAEDFFGLNIKKST